jgi:hypothetical protein
MFTCAGEIRFTVLLCEASREIGNVTFVLWYFLQPFARHSVESKLVEMSAVSDSNRYEPEFS